MLSEPSAAAIWMVLAVTALFIAGTWVFDNYYVEAYCIITGETVDRYGAPMWTYDCHGLGIDVYKVKIDGLR